MNDSELEFREFPKMARLSRECIITEKIDGTNAQILIGEGGEFKTGSRNRWITPESDNFGFSRWAHDHKDELLKLGPGRHFGEWWGSGIQRNYGIQEKRFSLFNVSRFCLFRESGVMVSADPSAPTKLQQVLPECVGLVPILYRGVFSTETVDSALSLLQLTGSLAAPGFPSPEGVVVFHCAAMVGFKKTIEKDEVPKGMR
jgi:hypothetical protein